MTQIKGMVLIADRANLLKVRKVHPDFAQANPSILRCQIPYRDFGRFGPFLYWKGKDGPNMHLLFNLALNYHHTEM